jgi:prepilin-type N-terminal cleavage/methylation domain-containing protein
MPLNPAPQEKGFTLVELSIVLVIVALISGGLMMSLSAQHEAASTAETQRRLTDARDSLLGFAAANGRLPCPAAPGTTGAESVASDGSCTNPWDGFLPAITLGLSPTDAQGYSIDDWGNPIRYAVTNDMSSQVSIPNKIKAAWNAGSTLAADLQICSTAAGITGSGKSASCSAGSTLANNAIAVIYSRGKNGGATPRSADESANGNADRVFVAHAPTQAGSASEFDDIVIWLSPNILYNRLIAAGRLP